MNNLFFKSRTGLIKNSPTTLSTLDRQFQLVLSELRHQRQDHVDIKLMLNKLLIDKHLQMQVDDFYEKQDGS